MPVLQPETLKNADPNERVQGPGSPHVHPEAHVLEKVMKSTERMGVLHQVRQSIFCVSFIETFLSVVNLFYLLLNVIAQEDKSSLHAALRQHSINAGKAKG